MIKLTFKIWLEKTERKAPENKGKDTKGATEPMDIFGAERLELNIDQDDLKTVMQTEPQVGAHIDFDDLDWKLMPFMIKDLSRQGAEVETFDDEDVPSQSFHDGQKNKSHGVHKGRVKRKELADVVGQGWQAAIAAAAGGAPPGGAPPGGEGLPPGLGV